MFERFTKKVATAATRAVKEETVKSVCDILPVVVGLASVVGVIIGCVPPKKVAPSIITVNNYFYGR